MAGLGPLDHVNPVRGHFVTAAVLGISTAQAGIGSFTAATPDVTVIDIVIVWDRNSRPVPHQIPITPSENVPLTQIVQRRLVDGAALHTVAANTFVYLVPTEKQQIGIMGFQLGNDVIIGKTQIVVTGEGRYGDFIFINRFFTDRTSEKGLAKAPVGISQRIDQSIRPIPAPIPRRNLKCSSSGHGVDCRLRDRFPFQPVFDSHFHARRAIADWRHLGGKLDRAFAECVLSKKHRTESPLGIMCNFSSVNTPVFEPELDITVVFIAVTDQRQITR